jgi:hypothetical protein
MCATALLSVLLLPWSAHALTTVHTDPVRVPWLIVGGGIHGVHIATRLLGEGLTTEVRIVDPEQALLFKWKNRTAATGMDYLRSSAGYHLDLSENSLRNFGKGATSSSLSATPFSNDYERPRLDLFNQHCDAIIAEHQLDKRHIQGVVTNLEPRDDHVRVIVSYSGDSKLEYIAEQVVLALGNDKPLYPDWVTQDLVDTGRARHLLDTDIFHSHRSSSKKSSVAIIGCGLTAVHKALQLVKDKTFKQIHLIGRSKIKEQQFDTHQDWMMDQAAAERSINGGGFGLPKRHQTFRDTSCLMQRRQIIAQERIPGTVTAAANRGRQGLQYAIRKNQIQWHQAEVASLSQSTANEACSLHLSSGTSIEVDQILLATGFGKCPPSLMQKLGLPVSDFCGYPIVDRDLRWGHPRVFVSGALAELELGPSARNIAGARLAAERIVQALRTRQTTLLS